MPRWTKRMMNSPVLDLLAGPTLGAAAAALFAVLCGVLSVALTWRLPTRPAWDFLWIVMAGTLAGLIAGLCRALDRVSEPLGQESVSTQEEVGPEGGYFRRPWTRRGVGIRRFLMPRTNRR